jgi:hypothetical protein
MKTRHSDSAARRKLATELVQFTYPYACFRSSLLNSTFIQDGKTQNRLNKLKEADNYSIQSIMEYNGGSVVAMVGKDCVAIASDLRLGNQALLIATNFEKVCMLVRTNFILIE